MSKPSYLVKIINAGEPAVVSFATRDEAIDYVNKATDAAGDKIREIADLGRDRYKITYTDGFSINLNIAKCISTVRYDLCIRKNDVKIQTRRFTTREHALNFAHRLLNDVNAPSDADEDMIGFWSRRSYLSGDHLTIKLTVVTVVEGDSPDFDLLGIKPNASMDEVKQAYRKLAIKHHPDKGGDAKKFAEINEAYNRIKNNESKSTTKRVTHRYRSIDAYKFIKNRKVGTKSSNSSYAFSPAQAQKKEKVEYDPVLISVAREKAGGMVVKGILELIIGIILTSASVFIFYGLIIVGIYNMLAGLYYCANPKALIRKK